MTSRRIGAESLITPELARALTEVSAEIQRQIGLLINRRGEVCFAVVGDARRLELPDLSAYRQGRDRLCGLRLVHTHLHGEGLDDDDLTDLVCLRLDAAAAIEVAEDGLPGPVHVARLLPANEERRPWEIYPPTAVHHLDNDFGAQLVALEEEFARRRQPKAAGDLREGAILVHVSSLATAAAEASLSELRDLARSAGIRVLDEVVQRRPLDPKYVMGKGRLQSTVVRAMQLGAEVLVFDVNLSPSQVKFVAEFTDLKILDRTQVILDIFGQRAETREGKIQVELAQLRYLLPRLGAKHSAMSRLTGGVGGRGPGETKLEIDRRRAESRISLLQREVKKLGDRRRLRRQRRIERETPTVAIVGYTNAGKSTLLNRLTRSAVTEQDVLFATLNPVSRRLRFPREREVIFTDTVGFIRQLPDELKDAFQTTFEEIAPSSLLLHVVDASDPEVEQRFETVRRMLAELEFDDKKAIVVLNKIDRCDAATVDGLARQLDGVPISALDPRTFAPLLERIESALWVGGGRSAIPVLHDSAYSAEAAAG